MFKRHEAEADLNDELRFHLEKEIEQNVARGMSSEEARRQALVAFGGLQQTKEAVREVGWIHFFEIIFQDVCYTLRILRKSPMFSAVTIAVMTIGIGANSAIFSAIDSVLIKMLPIKEPEKLVLLRYRDLRGRIQPGFSYPIFQQLRDENEVLSGVCAVAESLGTYEITLIGPGTTGQSERARISRASGEYFQVLGINAILGRTLTPEDNAVAGAGPVAVISYGYWKRRLGLNPSVLGKSFIVNHTAFTIVGVAPQGFFGETPGQSPDVWVPIAMADTLEGESVVNSANILWLEILGRLKPGVTQRQAAARIEVLLQEATAALLGPKAGSVRMAVEIVPASKGLDALRQRFSRPLQLLMGVVALILLIACVSVASLLAARATARQQEIATRVTLGASRQRLLQQLFTESLLLACAGGVLGLFFTWWTSRLLPILLFDSRTSLDLALDRRVLSFTLLISIVTGILFGMAPALQLVRGNLARSLKDDRVGLRGPKLPFGLRKILILLQVALSLLLLVGAGLFVRSLRNLNDVDPGFNKENLLLVGLQPDPALRTDERRILYQELLDSVHALPGVRSSSVSVGAFSDSGSNWSPMAVEGYTPVPGEYSSVAFDIVSPAFFETMGIPLLAGRDFRQQDDSTSPRVAIVNETFARHYFGNASPVGKHFALLRLDRDPMEIIGVVKDAKYSSLREQPRSFYYAAFRQPDRFDMTRAVRMLEVRTLADPLAMAGAVRSAVSSATAKLRVENITTMTVQVEDSLRQERMLAQLFSAFGIFALLLACVGLYGIMSYAVTRRTNEIGIRMALGAERSAVLWMMLREAFLLVSVGIAMGIPLAMAGAKLASSFVSGLLFGLKANDPATIVIAASTMTAVGILAGYLPARRAANVDPLVAIRYE